MPGELERWIAAMMQPSKDARAKPAPLFGAATDIVAGPVEEAIATSENASWAAFDVSVWGTGTWAA